MENFQLLPFIFFIISQASINVGSQCLIGIGNKYVEFFENFYIGSPSFRPVLGSIGSGGKHVYCYTIKSSWLEELPALQLQFYGETEHLGNQTSGTNHPLLATVHWHGSSRLWEIPIHFLNNSSGPGSDKVLGKTLWHYPNGEQRASWDLIVEISSYNSDETMRYKMEIVVVNNFSVKANTVIGGTASPSSPSFFLVNTTTVEDWEYVFILASSEEKVCTRISVQKINGPFLDPLENIRKVELVETFTLQAGLTMRKEKFPDGLLLVFHPLLNDKLCLKDPDPNELLKADDPFRTKKFQFQMSEAMPDFEYYFPVFLPLLLFFVIGCVSFLGLYYSKKQHGLLLTEEFSLIQRRHADSWSTINMDVLVNEEPSGRVEEPQSVLELSFVGLINFGIPSFTCMSVFKGIVFNSGDTDICYFNNLCSHMWKGYQDFNHMYSNIGYIFFGVLYGILVRYRRTFPNLSVNNGSQRQGVHVHYVLLYSLAIMIIMLGVMSTNYHICPNKSNFIFDTAFMYDIAAISTITIHKLRHPTNLSATFVSVALTLVICIPAFGLQWEQFYVQVVFTGIHTIFVLLTLLQLCFHGYVRREGRLVHSFRQIFYIICVKFKDDIVHGRLLKLQRVIWTAPHDDKVQIVPGPGRLIMPAFFLVINTIGVVGLWTSISGVNFASQVLFISVLNSSLYIIFYCGVKLFHGECRRILWLQAGIYLTASLIIWGIGIYVFAHHVSNWESTPAESRVLNEPCCLMGFYDNHDMWHFLSSMGLFCSGMLLLTIDDDLMDQPQSSIPVF
ncbi:unnamed protein product [Orchesella dallaii]|uniref:SID1 transmembrane family member 1 n=1 Tax=Orchesella dallaii TaxID=48710 RepID=A0ABP1QTU5_9HEXA